VVERVARAKRVVLVCAGALGYFALEDTACAGWIARALRDRGARLEGAEVAMAVTLAPTSRDDVRTVLQGSYAAARSDARAKLMPPTSSSAPSWIHYRQAFAI
jgi:phosphosulfolactate phosphohydrolase-like enzyme